MPSSLFYRKGKKIVDIGIVFGQMLLIFLMISIGYLVTKANILEQRGVKQLSWLVINITNPCLLLGSASEGQNAISGGEVLFMFLASATVYFLLALLGKFTGFLVGAKKEDYPAYHAITLFANVGFIGIPLVSSIFGSRYLLFVAVFNIWYCLVFYTFGMYLLRHKEQTGGFAWKKCINAGTVSGLFAILLFWADIKLPPLCIDFFTYVGKPTTFLSMLILGYSIGMTPWRQLLPRVENFRFLIWKMLFLPIALAFIGSIVMRDYPIIKNILVILVAMPAANMPLMVMQEQGRESEVLAKNIIFTTLMALVTIPAVAVFL